MPKRLESAILLGKGLFAQFGEIATHVDIKLQGWIKNNQQFLVLGQKIAWDKILRYLTHF